MMHRILRYFLATIWFLALSVSIFLLVSGRTGGGVITPWLVIPEAYVYLSALSLGLLAYFISSDAFSAKILLVFLSLQTFVVHSYLAFSHQLFFGADGWRHSASVERILAGLPLSSIALSNSTQSFIQYLNPGVIAYSHLWGLMLFFHAFSFSLISIIAWLVPVLWSLVVPVTLFKLGKTFGWSDRTALSLGALALVPYALTAGGSFTLPNSLGFIIFLPSLILLTNRLKSGDRKWLKWLLVYGLFLLTGYTLYAIIFWLLWGIAEVIFHLSLRASTQEERGNPLEFQVSSVSGARGGFMRLSQRDPWGLRPDLIGTRNDKLVKLVLVVVVALSIPAFELIAGYSQLPTSALVVLSGAKQFIGNLTGFYLALGPRPHAIATGNILLDQTPSYAFIANLLTEGRYWLVVIVCGIWLLLGVGLRRMWKSSDRIERWLAISILGLWGAYFVGRYVLQGEQILSRRLDMMLALSVIIILCAEGRKRLGALVTIPVFRRYVPVGIIVVMAAFTAAVYTLGPTDRAMSTDEYQAASYVWDQEKTSLSGSFCVLADTYPLLALEAFSAKRIVGGGFPINQYFAQPERDRLLKALPEKFSVTDWQEALKLTKSNHCWFISSYANLVEKTKGYPVKQFSGIGVWRYDSPLEIRY
jgi:hypothetical protein